MSLVRARAKINNIRNRVVPYGKKDKLELIDRNTHEVLAEARLWSWKKLNPLDKNFPNIAFRIAATTDTEELLATCDLSFNGLVHDVMSRDAPLSVNGIEWELLANPSNERTDV